MLPLSRHKCVYGADCQALHIKSADQRRLWHTQSKLQVLLHNATEQDKWRQQLAAGMYSTD